MTRSIRLAGAAALLGAAMLGLVHAAPMGRGEFDLSWHTVDGGGETFSTGGGFTLGGTMGQPDAGKVMNGGPFQLVGGFWPAATSGALFRCTADLNDDGQVDGDDLGTLLGQWGPCNACTADFNGDGQVDGDDLGTLLGQWGPCP
ncbi:MAG: hypothetical protein FJ253_02255 [Phycisphaerae bacterium]|nr:hypothetical protein [Phycisphaerae bacterium]